MNAISDHAPVRPPPDARPLVDEILENAIQQRASDIHIDPAANHYEVRYRVDGLMQTAKRYDVVSGRSIVGRLMVLAHLLTYRQDVPQEGRFVSTTSGGDLDLRLAIMPTTHGLRAAVRLPAELIQPRTLEDLNLPDSALSGLKQFALADSGMLILTGPAGSGKTTTIYALVEYIQRTSAGSSIVMLEDPVERDLPGVTQIEVAPFGQLTYERALRSILRHDPQVMVLGEIRDAATATLAIGAALSGHRLITSFHAATAGGAVARLIEMGIEPYQISSALFGVISQRLVRRLGEGGSHRGRIPLAEFALIDPAMRAAILRKDDAQTLQTILQKQHGFVSLRATAEAAVARGLTDAAEIARFLGPFSASFSATKVD